jgi:hypothetical protein
MAFNSALHPHVPAGSPAGGQFAASSKGSSKSTAKTSGKSGTKTTAKRAPAKTATGGAPLPGRSGKGGRYTPAQFAELQQLQKQAAGGKKLTAKQAHALHVAHELHVGHEQHLAAMGVKRSPKLAAKKRTATTAKRTTAKTGIAKTTAVKRSK